jgi:proteic killer suppression protein
MIRTFKDSETEKLYQGLFSKKLPQSIHRVALRKLIMIDNAKTLMDLKIPPANHLEQLYGDRIGQHSIRINDQYRICFKYDNGDFYNVEITDYH